MDQLEEIRNFIKVIKLDLYDIITRYQSGHDNAATVKVAAVTQGLIALLTGINSGNTKDIINIDYNKFNNILINTSKSIENENYILIDDLFEYELIPMLDGWISQLDSFASNKGTEL